MGMRATSLYNIATELISQDEKKFKDYGRKLLYEYSIKKNLSRDVEMLKLRFEDKVEELNEKVRNSILPEGAEADEGVGIEKLISDALTRCMVTLVHDGKAKSVRKGFNDFDLIEIRNNFESEVLLNENSNVIKWFEKNVFALKFEISDGWREIVFEDESYAALLLIDVITEIIINIFKYADKRKTVEIRFTEDSNCLLINTQNHVCRENDSGVDAGHGLDSENDALHVLNECNGLDRKAIIYGIEGEVFKAEISVARSLFCV
jgi:hypothetical protein